MNTRLGAVIRLLGGALFIFFSCSFFYYSIRYFELNTATDIVVLIFVWSLASTSGLVVGWSLMEAQCLCSEEHQ